MTLRTIELRSLRQDISIDIAQRYPREILVVLVETKRFLPSLDFFSRFLAPDDQIRATRYFAEKLRVKFIIHRGILRWLCSQLLGLSQRAIIFHKNEYGKPFLAKEINKQDLRFNLSHSGAYAMYAFISGAELGIDLEDYSRDIPAIKSAAFFLAESELRELNDLPLPCQKNALLRIWTQKEALSKALSLGLSMNFKELIIGINSRSIIKNMLADRRLDLYDLSLQKKYFASLAIDMSSGQHLDISFS